MRHSRGCTFLICITCIESRAALLKVNALLLAIVEELKDDDCDQPWGVHCSAIDDSGEKPCLFCRAKEALAAAREVNP